MSRKREYGRDDDIREAKRHRYDSEPKDIEERLSSLINRVGEKSTSSLENNLEGLARVLEADLPGFRSTILEILGKCVITMPEKTTIYSTLVGLLNAKNYNFGGEFIDLLVKHLKDALKNCRFEHARYIVRFMADLVNCYAIFAHSFLTLATTFVEVTLESGIPQVRSDWYVYTILSSLPLVGRELYEKKEQELDHLLKMIENYINKRHKIHHPALRVWEVDTPHLQEEYLDCLWVQIGKLRADKWVEHHIPRPYLAFDKKLCEALQHYIPAVAPPLHRDDAQYPYPTVVFRLFDYTDCPENLVLPGAHSIDRFFIEEQLQMILKHHHTNRKECATLLLNFPGKHKIPLEYMIVEVIFGEMFRLPVSNYLLICLGSILLELCKMMHHSMPLVLAQAIQLIYERLDTMNPECIDRFSQWFAYHLSNFQLKWSWDIWNDCLAFDPLHPKTKFVIEAINKLLRLSYHQKIIEALPESFSPLLPPNPLPYCKYFQEGGTNLPGVTAAHHLNQLFKDRCTPTEALAALKDLPNPLQEEDEASFNPLKIDVFVQTLLFVGSKSVSHSAARLAKYISVFQDLITCEEAQTCVLRSTYEVWRFNQQMVCLLINKYLKLQIVESAAVVNWIFSKEMAPEFTRSYIWEILHATIRRVVKNAARLQKEIAEARAKLQKDDDDDDEDEDDEDDEDYVRGRSRGRDRDGDRALEEKVESMEEKLESAQMDQKKLFLIVFQHFIMLLTEHIVRSDKEGLPLNNLWFKWALARLQGIFFMHHNVVFKYASTLETIMFTNETDPHILTIFHRFLSLQT